MSEDKKPDKEGEECPTREISGDDRIVEIRNNATNSDINAPPHSTANDIRWDSDQDSRQYIVGEIEVQTSDVLAIEEMPEQMCHESKSDEKLESKVSYEYTSDMDEVCRSQLPQTYFDNTEILRSPESAKVLNIDEIGPASEVHGKGKMLASLGNKSQEEATSGNAASEFAANLKNVLESNINKRVKEMKEGLVPDTPRNSLVSLGSPFVPMYELTYLRSEYLDARDLPVKKYQECNSDDFADVEDNLIDSSPSDSIESTDGKSSGIPMIKHAKYAASLPVKLGQKHGDEKQGTKRATSESSSVDNNGLARSNILKEKLEDKNLGNSFPEASCSSVQQGKTKRVRFPDAKIPESGKKENILKGPMETIKEEKESEETKRSPKVAEPPVSKTNPLKMRAKVGKRKDRCNVCNVRLGLCAIKCRCGGYYCAKHRYDKEHDCTFDYKSMGAEEIRKNNPRIVAEKVKKL